MRAGWLNIGIGLFSSHSRRINWWRATGSLAIWFSVFVWCVLIVLTLHE